MCSTAAEISFGIQGGSGAAWILVSSLYLSTMNDFYEVHSNMLYHLFICVVRIVCLDVFEILVFGFFVVIIIIVVNFTMFISVTAVRTRTIWSCQS
jgi:hypothetical protein